MIGITFDNKKFIQQMNNIVAYADGFVEGAAMSKGELLKNIGQSASESIGNYIDAIARSNPTILHHVYEWAQAGSKSGRLFDVGYTVTGGGLTMHATMTQSRSIKRGSNAPFYNKARIMENGIPVRITPKEGGVLSFNDDGKQVFTKKPVVVSKPGGAAVEGQLENTFEEYVSVYLSQALFSMTGLDHRLSNPVDFKNNIRRGASGGKSVGLTIGRKWITGGVL